MVNEIISDPGKVILLCFWTHHCAKSIFLGHWNLCVCVIPIAFLSLPDILVFIKSTLNVERRIYYPGSKRKRHSFLDLRSTSFLIIGSIICYTKKNRSLKLLKTLCFCKQ